MEAIQQFFTKNPIIGQIAELLVSVVISFLVAAILLRLSGKLFKRLREQRRREVGEWFVVLDKAVAMKDWAKARSQAQWIVSHATLNGERPDVRRAADILATKIPAEDAGAEKK